MNQGEISIKVQKKDGNAFRTNISPDVSLEDLRLLAGVEEDEKLFYVDKRDQVILDTQKDVNLAIKWSQKSNNSDLTLRGENAGRWHPKNWKKLMLLGVVLYVVLPGFLFKLALLIGVVRHYWKNSSSSVKAKCCNQIKWDKLFSGKARKAMKSVQEQVMGAFDSEESEEENENKNLNNNDTVEKLKTLHNLGFKDAEKNLAILKKNNNDVNQAINALLNH